MIKVEWIIDIIAMNQQNIQTRIITTTIAMNQQQTMEWIITTKNHMEKMIMTTSHNICHLIEPITSKNTNQLNTR
jgi:hypothetical protein